ncbi:MAG: hypothetical protein EXR69_15425 [Myxococcales bacterium]|nr:hypothetical protein [Myxococcales bacterium]
MSLFLQAGLTLLVGCCPTPASPEEHWDTAVWLAAPEIEPTLGLDDLDGAVASAISGGAVFPLTFLATWEQVVADIGALGSNDGSERGCEGGFFDSTTAEGHVVAECFSTEGITGEEYLVTGGWMADLSMDERGGTRIANVLYSFQATRLATDDSLHGGGHLYAGWTDEPDGIRFDLRLEGTYLDTGAADASANTVGAGTWWVGRWSHDGFVATFEGPTGSGTDALDFRSFSLDAALGPGPAGSLHLRDPGGGWWQLDFGDDHSGCGAASFDGQRVGDTCAGLAAVEPLHTLFLNAEAAGW